MNALDIIIGVILVYCLVRGIFRGLIEEVSSIIGVLGGFYGAFTYYPEAARLLGRWISNDAYANIVGFLIIFALVVILVGILGIVIKYLMNIASLGWADRILGAGAGALKGILIVSVLLVALTTFLPKGAPVIRESILAPRVTVVSEALARVVSQEMKAQFTTKMKVFKDAWKKKS
ncbi:MAG: CvpA family protein [Desulfobacterales bacterium]